MSGTSELPEGFLIRLADVKPQPVAWLWPERIPLGFLTLIAGDPGVGKSWLTHDLAARITTGAARPGTTAYAPCGDVLIASAEDSPETVIRPRIDALGGDPTRVRLVSPLVKEDGPERALSLSQDLPHIAAALHMTEARLLIFDTLDSFLPPGTDMYRSNEVRAVLLPLVRLAGTAGTSIVGVMHLNKDSDKTALHRVLGSIALVGVVRSVLTVTMTETDGVRRVDHIKTNLGRLAPPLSFRVVEVDGTPRTVWSQAPDGIPQKAPARGRPPVERNEAKRFLQDFLGTILRPKAIVQAEATNRGLDHTTLKRAFDDLRGEEVTQIDEPTGERIVFWRLPAAGVAA